MLYDLNPTQIVLFITEDISRRGHNQEGSLALPADDAFRSAAPSTPLPRVVSLQNAFSLTCRTFESHLAECCLHEGVSLLAYSPLAMGLLTVSQAAGSRSSDPY